MTNKLKVLLQLLLILLLLTLSAAALAGQAEDLTASCTLKVTDNPGKTTKITDGKYTTYWESSKKLNPYLIISSDKPIYGLYLCFQRMPERYVIQKASGDGWVTVAEGGSPRFHHVFFELDGLKKIRILSTEEKKNKMGFNEIYAFGEGEIPDWVQRWEAPVEKADLMVLVAHPDDELLFTGGMIPTYGVQRQKQVEVVYLTSSNTTRRSEALNGLWAMGIRNYPVFGEFSDRYAKTGKLKDAYKEAGGKAKVLEWVTGLFRRFRPEVVVTHAENGEYGHPQHKMTADACVQCFTLAADASQYPESAREYGPWQVKKLYLHLYGEESAQTVLDWDQPLSAFGGRTGAELAAEAFALHVSQQGMGTGKGKNFVEFTVEETGAKMYPYNRFGLHSTTVSPDEAKNDLLEHIAPETGNPAGGQEPEPGAGTDPEAPAAETGTAEPGDAAIPEDGEELIEETVTEEATAEGEGTEAAETTETAEGTAPAAGTAEAQPAGTEETEEELTEEIITEGNAEPAEKPAAGDTGVRFSDTKAPEWADVALNDRGFLDEGEYILEDPENGHWMYVNRTLRIQVVRDYRTYEKAKKKDPEQAFYCFTAHIWCDWKAGELPHTVYSNPETPRTDPKFIKEIASEQHVVFAISTDYYTYRAGRARQDKSAHVGIVIRDGQMLYDDPQIREMQMPNYETLALYRDGHVDSYPSKDRSADEYLADGATEVYTFGPCLVKNGQLTEYIANANRVNNPRHAFGMVEPGHYVDVICEGRVRKSATKKRSTGVLMENLAQIMLDEGCQVAVNLDGGQTAVCAFMGKQLNRVVRTDPSGRKEVEVLAFGSFEPAGSAETK